MNLKMIRPKNETQDSLLSIFNYCETFIKKRHTKPEETLKYKFTKTREAFHFNPSINLGLDFNWMIGLKTSEMYNSVFDITEKKENFLTLHR